MYKIMLKLFMLISLTYIEDISALCNICQVDQYVCVDQNKYQYCSQYNPIGDVITCPPGKYCHETFPCKTLDNNELPDCKCGYCNRNSADNFACISKTQRATCTASNELTTQYESCGTNMYCGIENGATIKCVSYADPVLYACDVIPLSCVSSGKFPVANSGCKKYYICELSNGVLTKYDYSCSGTTLFDPSTSKCVLNHKC